MELIDAYEIVKVSPEEIASIERYLGFMHTGFNVLADLTPERYSSLNKSGWKLPETEEEIRDSITDFANIYSAMYKESRGRTTRLNLIRGTNRKDVPKTNSTINQMLSTSTDEGIARTFCKYQDAALIRFNVEAGVPFLDAEDYRSESGANEKEIILAPFCHVSKSEFTGEYETYAYHNVSIKKPKLEEVPEEEIQTLFEEVVSGFVQNIENIKEYIRLSDEYEILFERIKREKDPEEKKYMQEKKESLFAEYQGKSESVTKFKEKLQRLLKGLCKQKELEYEKAKEIVEQEEKRLQEDLRKRVEEERKKQDELRKETDRANTFSTLDTKYLKMPGQSHDLETILENAYKKMLETENTYRSLAEKFQIPYTKLVTAIGLDKKIEDIKNNLKLSQDKVNQTTFSVEDSYETIKQVEKELTPIFDGIAYSLEISHDIPEIVQMHQKQSDNEIKRNLYLKSESIIRQARVDKYLKDRDVITKKGISFFSGFTRKNDLQIERLNNVNLKIQLAQNSVPEEQEEYSIKGILANMYACAITELGGKFTPEMQQFYESLKTTFEDFDEEKITEDDVKALAREKIMREKSFLPAVPTTTKKTFFGKTKSQIELLRLENKGLETQIAQEKSRPKMSGYETDAQDAVAALDMKIKGISKFTAVHKKDKEKEDLDKTADLWE